MSHTTIDSAASESKTKLDGYIKATSLKVGMMLKCSSHDEDGDVVKNREIASIKPTNCVNPYYHKGALLEVIVKGWSYDPIYIGKSLWIEVGADAVRGAKSTADKLKNKAKIPKAVKSFAKDVALQSETGVGGDFTATFVFKDSDAAFSAERTLKFNNFEMMIVETLGNGTFVLHCRTESLLKKGVKVCKMILPKSEFKFKVVV